MASPAKSRALLVAAVAAGALFAAGAAFLRGGPSSLDTTVSVALQPGEGTRGEAVFVALSWPGNGVLAPALLVLAVAAVAARHRGTRSALALVLFCAAAFLVAQAAKAGIERARPTAPVRVVGTAPTTGAYPSGHVVWFTTLAGGAAVLGVLPRRRPARALVLALAALYALALGVSRVALGHHHPTDVVAGYLLGFVFVAVLAVVAVVAAVSSGGPSPCRRGPGHWRRRSRPPRA